jgi:hypothetical protein
LPTPTRAAVKTYADAEWHRCEGEAAMMDPIEASERKSIEAWCNWWPECEAAGPDEPTSTAQASTYRRTTEASTYRRTTEASTDHRATDASTHPAVKASTKAVPTTHTVSTGHSTAMSTSTSTVSAPAMSTTTTSRCNSWGKSDRGTDCGGGGNGNKRSSKHGTVSS